MDPGWLAGPGLTQKAGGPGEVRGHPRVRRAQWETGIEEREVRSFSKFWHIYVH